MTTNVLYHVISSKNVRRVSLNLNDIFIVCAWCAHQRVWTIFRFYRCTFRIHAVPTTYEYVFEKIKMLVKIK